jgi:predicted GNAT family acetyltransferase
MTIQRHSDRYVYVDHTTVIATLAYTKETHNVLSIDSIIVSPDYRGRGIGGMLLEAFVQDARQNGQRILPRCSFAKAAFLKRPDYQEIQAHV